MSCWICECGMRNCDLDECCNPKCPSHIGLTFTEANKILLDAGCDAPSFYLNKEKVYNNYYNVHKIEKIAKYIAIKGDAV